MPGFGRCQLCGVEIGAPHECVRYGLVTLQDTRPLELDQYAVVWYCPTNRPADGDYLCVRWEGATPDPTHLTVLVAGPYPTHQQAAAHYLTSPPRPRPTP